MMKNIPKRDDWNKFLNNEEIIINLNQYERNINIHQKNWKINISRVNEDLFCNHTQADTKFILDASKPKYPVVIGASDTGVLLLMCYAHWQLFPENHWLMKTDSERCVSVAFIKLYFEKNMCCVLPVYHCIIGYDKTQYPTNIGKSKARVFQKLKKLKKQKQAFHQLKNLVSQ